jgi:hypothetical protein
MPNIMPPDKNLAGIFAFDWGFTWRRLTISQAYIVTDSDAQRLTGGRLPRCVTIE